MPTTPNRRVPHLRHVGAVSIVALGVAAGLQPGHAAAQTLQDALVQAYQSNPQLLAERANLRATDEGVPQALANWRPTVQLSASQGYTHVDSTSPEAVTNVLGQPTGKTADVSGSSNSHPQTYGVSITQPLYRGGRTVAQTAEALNLVQAERARLVAEEQTIMLTVATDYMNVVRDQATVDLDINNEQVLKRQLEQTQDQFRVGEVTRTDVAQAEASYAQAIATRQAAEGALQVDRAAFEHDVGIAPGKLVAPTGLPPLPTKREAAVDLASTSNPNVIAAQFAQQASEDNVNVVRGQLLPQVGLTASWQHAKDSTNTAGLRADDAQVVAQVTMPLYEGGAIYSQTRQAKQTVAQRKSQVDDARRVAVQSAASFWEQMLSDRATITSLQAAIRANEISLDGTRQEAAVGQRTVLDILNAEQVLLQSRVNLVSSQHDEIVAELSLASAIGALTAKNLGLPVELYEPDKNFNEVRDKWVGFGSAE
ncbi:type I secretion protein TolC [Aliidongia dinghuensis]|uniref:Type I secretion protein TolC n=1 Tax=Aliidongia dinghuensis TaxID=1867774 RepID=A0A8J3E4D3_9PROT|nr:TolC family outer membrane protein [Aliidongia dinghuensis]GGF13538.1 type I secretion protein TolC [Aliidongia dinghuensis]